MELAGIDHFVLTVSDLEATIAFYERLGMRAVTFGEGRRALAFGDQKINLHGRGREFEPRAAAPTSGSSDFCVLVATPLDRVIEELARDGVEIEIGPVVRSGARGPIRSVYVRDPDGNLVELAEPAS